MPAIFKKRYLIAAVIIIILVGASLFVYGFAPIMRVEGKTVTLAEFLKVYSALKSFDRVSQKTPTNPKELKRHAMETLVENRFLEIMIQRTDADLARQAQIAVESAVGSTPNLSLGEASGKLYGLSGDDFKKLVLFPQAEKDLLTKHYAINQQQLADLWNGLIQHGEVKIYYPGFYWDGEVKIK